MPTLSTHVLDSAAGGGRPGVAVAVTTPDGTTVASGVTDAEGRTGHLASSLPRGTYRISWGTGGDFLAEVSVTVHLTEDRHYHVPLLASPVSAVAYLGQ